MSYEVNTKQLGGFSVALTGGTATAGGGVASIPNPEGVDLIVKNAILYVATNSTGASNLTAGIGTAPTHSVNNMLTTTAMAAAAGKAYQLNAYGTAVAAEITAPGIWGADEYLNVTGSASSVGLTGTLYVDYYRVE